MDYEKDIGRIVKHPKSDSAIDVAKHSLESLATELYSNWNDMKKDLGPRYIQPIKSGLIRAYEYTKDSVKRGKDINEALIVGTAASIATNIGISYAINSMHWDLESLNGWSYGGELFGGVLASVWFYTHERRKENARYGQIAKELLRVASIAFPISYWPYQWTRSHLSDFLVNNNYPPSLAPPTSQLVLLPFYLLALDIFGPWMGYTYDQGIDMAKRVGSMAMNGGKKVRESYTKRVETTRSRNPRKPDRHEGHAGRT